MKRLKANISRFVKEKIWNQHKPTKVTASMGKRWFEKLGWDTAWLARCLVFFTAIAKSRAKRKARRGSQSQVSSALSATKTSFQGILAAGGFSFRENLQRKLHGFYQQIIAIPIGWWKICQPKSAEIFMVNSRVIPVNCPIILSSNSRSFSL